MTLDGYRIAVLLPCRNEEPTVGGVVRSFREALPGARVYVYDNLSTDGTAGAASAAGAAVRSESLPGKGNVVRRMFADVEADIYVLADGDGTYEAEAAPSMIERLVAGNLDMVVGVRVADGKAWRRGHRLGNALMNRLIASQFGGGFADISSGYRVMSRRFVKTFPAESRSFEIEVELAAHSAQLRLPAADLPVGYAARPPGSESKLRTLRDGARALFAAGLLVKEWHPLRFFSLAGAACALLALGLAAPVLIEYRDTGLVPRLPTLVTSVGLGLAAGGCFLAGVVLDSVGRGRREAKRLAYLRCPSVRALPHARGEDGAG